MLVQAEPSHCQAKLKQQKNYREWWYVLKQNPPAFSSFQCSLITALWKMPYRHFAGINFVMATDFSPKYRQSAGIG
jgi:hypothetical protein